MFSVTSASLLGNYLIEKATTSSIQTTTHASHSTRLFESRSPDRKGPARSLVPRVLQSKQAWLMNRFYLHQMELPASLCVLVLQIADLPCWLIEMHDLECHALDAGSLSICLMEACSICRSWLTLQSSLSECKSSQSLSHKPVRQRTFSSSWLLPGQKLQLRIDKIQMLICPSVSLCISLYVSLLLCSCNTESQFGFIHVTLEWKPLPSPLWLSTSACRHILITTQAIWGAYSYRARGPIFVFVSAVIMPIIQTSAITGSTCSLAMTQHTYPQTSWRKVMERRYAVALRFLPGRVHGCDLLHITLAFIVSRGLNIRPGHQREL